MDDNNSREIIELGNGYGYFCNVHDIENQYKVREHRTSERAQMLENYPEIIYHRRIIRDYSHIEDNVYLEEIRPSTEDSDMLCTVITIAMLFALCLFVM